MTNVKKFDLEERTERFGTEIIKFAKMISENSITKPLITHLIRSGTSIGANYCEADNAESRYGGYWQTFTRSKRIKPNF